MEVCNLHEIGYPLTSSQGDLTPIQKLFILLAYPVYHAEARRQGRKNKTHPDMGSDPNMVIDHTFEERTRQRIMEKRRNQ